MPFARIKYFLLNSIFLNSSSASSSTTPIQGPEGMHLNSLTIPPSSCIVISFIIGSLLGQSKTSFPIFLSSLAIKISKTASPALSNKYKIF